VRRGAAGCGGGLNRKEGDEGEYGGRKKRPARARELAPRFYKTVRETGRDGLLCFFLNRKKPD
jgi:hypothetical protein